MLDIADGALDPSSRREMWLVMPVAIKRDIDVPLSPDDEPLPVAAELEVGEAPVCSSSRFSMVHNLCTNPLASVIRLRSLMME